MGEKGADMPFDKNFKMDLLEETKMLQIPDETHVQVEPYPFSGEGPWIKTVREKLLADFAKAKKGEQEINFPECFPGPESLLFDDLPEYCSYMKYTLPDNPCPNPDCAKSEAEKIPYGLEDIFPLYSECSVFRMLPHDPAMQHDEDKKVFWESEVYCAKCDQFTRREYCDPRLIAGDGEFNPKAFGPMKESPLSGDGPACLRPSPMNRPLCMIDLWGEAPKTINLPCRDKPTNPPSLCMLDLPDENGEWTMYNQCKPSKSEYFPNPGDPDYKPYKERNEANRHEWGPKREAMDRVTQNWLNEKNQDYNREQIERTFGLKRLGDNGQPEDCPWEVRAKRKAEIAEMSPEDREAAIAADAAPYEEKLAELKAKMAARDEEIKNRVQVVE